MNLNPHDSPFSNEDQDCPGAILINAEFMELELGLMELPNKTNIPIVAMTLRCGCPDKNHLPVSLAFTEDGYTKLMDFFDTYQEFAQEMKERN